MKKQGMNVHTLTQLALLMALELVMANTPLGMIPIGPINASLLTIPVAIGAMLLGPAAGALLGAIFLLVCDTAARTLFAPYELPVGILLNVIGGVFFLYLLLGRKRGRVYD